MRFRQYSDTSSTVKEWSRQLNTTNNGIYRLYPTVEQTLTNWKNILNTQTETNTFTTFNTPEQTLLDWQEKLNIIYNN